MQSGLAKPCNIAAWATTGVDYTPPRPQKIDHAANLVGHGIAVVSLVGRGVCPVRRHCLFQMCIVHTYTVHPSSAAPLNLARLYR